MKHVRLLPEKVETIAEKFSCGGKVFDSEVYSALKAFNAQGRDEGESADIK